jgi:hypothetical protein
MDFPAPQIALKNSRNLLGSLGVISEYLLGGKAKAASVRIEVSTVQDKRGANPTDIHVPEEPVRDAVVVVALVSRRILTVNRVHGVECAAILLSCQNRVVVSDPDRIHIMILYRQPPIPKMVIEPIVVNPGCQVEGTLAGGTNDRDVHQGKRFPKDMEIGVSNGNQPLRALKGLGRIGVENHDKAAFTLPLP